MKENQKTLRQKLQAALNWTDEISASSSGALCERDTVISGIVFLLEGALPGDEKSYLHFWANSPFDGGTAQNALSVPEPSMFVWALARKHPWCFHSHTRPVLLTFTSAFMWPNPKANLGTHNMFINQSLKTDPRLIIQVLKPHKKQNMAKKDIPKDVLQVKSVALRTVILVPVFSLSAQRLQIPLCKYCFVWCWIEISFSEVLSSSKLSVQL